MKLHQLQALIAVADGGGIRAAARGLGLSQSAITRALRELEEEQGLPLLVRHAGGARLGEAGLVLLPHARQIASQLENAQRDLANLRGEVPTSLCVGVTPWFGQTLLAAAVQAFRREMPAVRLELYEGLQAVSLPLLRSGVMHFALGPAGALPAQEFIHEPLARYRMKVVAREGHPSQAARSLAELLEQDWVMNFTQAGYDQVAQEVFGRHGYVVCPGRIVCAQSSAMLTSLIVNAGLLGYSPEPMLLCEPMRGRVRALELDEALADGDISLIRLRDQALDPAARCFIQCLQQALKACARSRNADDRRLADMLELQF
ncbi:LysR family transcriptional regulator [Pseudomonas sp. BN417]|uniref:LysR family transcriptional regulator n=1 Tax=Pseudomonas sp. BN417 TaxID=2567890 RepID=UPI0024539C1A|nr:LysR substrate-binding domain-containing protein [Pseudomonas sp. BN417]MDH4554510.1 LysR family transcriptional regulator [Pseudomonas sp. BN417]